MKNFIYSVSLNKENASATAFELAFGVSNDSFWLFKIDIDEKTISVHSSTTEIKTVSYPFLTNREYKLDLIVNDGVLKAYIDENDTASLVAGIDGYKEGDITDNLNTCLLTHRNKSITSIDSLNGDVFLAGYTLDKIVNLTDNNYRLETSQYTNVNGTVSIDQEYLNTLETNTIYKFRAVTSFTDLDFYVATNEVGAEANSLVAKYYRGNDAKFELSKTEEVYKVLVDNEEFAFEKENNVVTIKNDNLKVLTSGDHVAKFFTDNGRPEAKFSLYEAVETLPEVPAPVNHTFFFIDIAIFGVLILGYVLFTYFKKVRK